MARPPRSHARRSSYKRGQKKEPMQMLLQILLVMVLTDDDSDAPAHRDDFVYRERRSFYTFVRPMVEDNTFRKRFSMDYTDFMTLADILRPKLRRGEKMGALRNGAIPVEFQLAMTLRFLAGGSVFEVMDSNVIAKSTAYAIVHLVVDAINQTRELDCTWPEGDEAEAQAELYRRRSTNGVIRRCVGAMDGLFVRLIQPCLKRHCNPGSFYSGHKKAFGMKFQFICNASYEIIAWTMNCPGSPNDRTAFKNSGFDALLRKLPPDCFIVGDAAYPASNQVLVPYPGTALTLSQDAYNFYQSQARVSIEQAFGILVKWRILWKPLAIRLDRVGHVMNTIVRLHNFLRRRRAPVPQSARKVSVPESVTFHPDGGISGSYYDTVPAQGRPSKAAEVSMPRELIRDYLDQKSMGRPRSTLNRNANRVI